MKAQLLSVIFHAHPAESEVNTGLSLFSRVRTNRSTRRRACFCFAIGAAAVPAPGCTIDSFGVS
jgi:hypothetical protein